MSVAADPFHPFMNAVYSSSDGYQRDNAPRQKVISNCFHFQNVSTALLFLNHETLRSFIRKKGVQPNASDMYLIKWPDYISSFSL